MKPQFDYNDDRSMFGNNLGMYVGLAWYKLIFPILQLLMDGISWITETKEQCRII